ncbi:protein CLP1 homolog isoform X2 [Hyalella azteca]|uniref:Protein CLP1 homolog n=1 Tax=Hyalella azteca TaxID=294128 RepID=A0A8B7NMJ0_HYAAZ|nr:protein CLP1 homolog isoform X1 [Hyalella azteca]XP_047741206.1 protein CLP1 homolog isoform X2 [Hyalella azteca]
MEHDFTLQQDSELRFEAERDAEDVSLKLLDGKAEIFGTELAPNKQYTFLPGAKVAVFTWHGCRLRLMGKTTGTYIATETPMVMYLNTHGCLERLRRNAERATRSSDEASHARGPICMVVGPGDVGKSTLCRILLNYAVRFGRRPIYVDLDVGQSSLSVPGTLGAVLVERAASVREGFSQEAPLVYSFGDKTPSSNMTLYNILVQKMGSDIHAKMASNKKVSVSGAIINTCGWVMGDGYKSVTHIAQSFEVDLIIVLDQERLYNDLVQDIPFIRVLYLPKSGGVVTRPRNVRATDRDERIRRYFYGLKTKFHPHTFDVKFSHVKIYKIGAPELPASCMPCDMKVDDHRTKIVPVEPGNKVKHCLLALSMATEPADLLTANVMGFICVVDVDESAGVLKVLSPHPKPLPDTLLLLTQTQFIDSA